VFAAHLPQCVADAVEHFSTVLRRASRAAVDRHAAVVTRLSDVLAHRSSVSAPGERGRGDTVRAEPVGPWTLPTESGPGVAASSFVTPCRSRRPPCAVMARTMLPASQPPGSQDISVLVGQHTTLYPSGRGQLRGRCPARGNDRSRAMFIIN
jgi:hypothetical protein